MSSFYDDDGILYDSTFLANNCATPAIITVKNRIDSVLKYAQYDMLDLHLYDDSEQWDEYYYNFKDTITKPIIVSEFGGPNMNLEPYSESYQANKLDQYIKKLDSIEISEIYYFKLVEGSANPAHSTSGLIDDSTLMPKLAYSVIKSFTNCTSLNFINNPEIENVIFYPNPAVNLVSFELKSKSNFHFKIQVFSSNGRLLQENKGINGNYQLNTENLNSGLYLVQIKSNNQLIGKGKLIIQK